jgi:hypothetical protein
MLEDGHATEGGEQIIERIVSEIYKLSRAKIIETRR